LKVCAQNGVLIGQITPNKAGRNFRQLLLSYSLMLGTGKTPALKVDDGIMMNWAHAFRKGVGGLAKSAALKT